MKDYLNVDDVVNLFEAIGGAGGGSKTSEDKNHVDKYVEKHLIPLLKKRLDSPGVLEIIEADVKERMYSLLALWNDENMIKPILFTGLEEAVFWKPEIDLEKASFVVVGLRNSILEDLVSTKLAAEQYGFEESPIEEDYIKTITENALRYFRDIDFNELSQTTPKPKNNQFLNLNEKYPLAWKAISELAYNASKYTKFSPIVENTETVDDIAKELSNSVESKDTDDRGIVTELQSGIDPAFSSTLAKLLLMTVEEKIEYFYTDSFKTISRNIDKLMKTIEYLLGTDSKVIMKNFYLTNGYVSKRNPLIRPSHTQKEYKDGIVNPSGMTKAHLKALKDLKDRYNNLL